MKQFYLLLIVGLLLSGLVLVGPRLRSRHHLLDEILDFFSGPRALILLSFFDLSVGFSNLVWVDDGIPVFQHLFPALTLVMVGTLFGYLYFLEIFPAFFVGRKFFLLQGMQYLSQKSFRLGLVCCAMAFVHFFAESIVFF
ncbi:MAG: hypothetical protein ACRCVN_07425 [Spirochaetia bacterium]